MKVPCEDHDPFVWGSVANTLFSRQLMHQRKKNKAWRRRGGLTSACVSNVEQGSTSGRAQVRAIALPISV